MISKYIKQKITIIISYRSKKLKNIKEEAAETLAEYKEVEQRKFDQSLAQKRAELDNQDNSADNAASGLAL